MTVFERYILFKETHNINQGELAKGLNKSQSALSQQEKGGKISIETIHYLRKAYNLNTEWLFTGNGEQLIGGNTLNINQGRLIELERENQRLEEELSSLKVKYNKNNERLIILQDKAIGLQEEIANLKKIKGAN